MRWFYSLLLSFILLSTSIAADAYKPQGVIALSLPVDGVVKQVTALEGKAYAAGDVLLRLDTQVIEQQVRAASATLRSLEADFAEAKREYERSLELYDRTVLSEHDLQLAEIAFSKAEAEHEQAKLALAEANWQRQYAVLKAPYPGVVSKVHAFKGQAVSNGLKPQVLIEFEVQ